MATYRSFTDVPGLQVECEDNGGAAADPSLAALLDAIRTIVSSTGDRLRQLSGEQRPTELSLTFGLRAVNGGFAVGLDPTANFRISMIWSQEPAVPEPEIPAFPGL